MIYWITFIYNLWRNFQATPQPFSIHTSSIHSNVGVALSAADILQIGLTLQGFVGERRRRSKQACGVLQWRNEKYQWKQSPVAKLSAICDIRDFLHPPLASTSFFSFTSAWNVSDADLHEFFVSRKIASSFAGLVNGLLPAKFEEMFLFSLTIFTLCQF